jgi:hypothetical protein
VAEPTGGLPCNRRVRRVELRGGGVRGLICLGEALEDLPLGVCDGILTPAPW